jgi:hypothetical protein
MSTSNCLSEEELDRLILEYGVIIERIVPRLEDKSQAHREAMKDPKENDPFQGKTPREPEKENLPKLLETRSMVMGEALNTPPRTSNSQ